MSEIKKTIEIKVIAEGEQIIKDVFKKLADVLNEDWQLDGYKIQYIEDKEEG